MASENHSAKDEDAALNVLKEAMHKDYWSVNSFQDNSEELQGAIDVAYNTFEGNNYSVEYQENQSGTRLVIHCKVCSKDLTSYDPFLTHENGKNHKKVRQRMLTVPDPNLESNLELQQLNMQRGTFATGSLEDEIDSSRYTILGVQFVYKEIIDGTVCYTCQLCQRSANVHQISSSKMFAHVTSSKHNQSYLKAKFRFEKKPARGFEEDCCSIEKFEGRIHANITDLTPLNSMKSSKEPHSSWPPRRSGSHSPHEVNPKIPKAEYPEMKDSSDAAENCTKPPTSDVGTSTDISSETQYILYEINAMQEPDCQMILKDDDDMQDLLKETLWVLANKMEKYYNQTGASYIEGKTQTPLSVCAEKVKQYIAEFAGLK